MFPYLNTCHVIFVVAGKRPATVAPGWQLDAFSWLLHLWLLAAGSEPDAAEPGGQVLAVTTRPAAILMVRLGWGGNPDVFRDCTACRLPSLIHKSPLLNMKPRVLPCVSIYVRESAAFDPG